jgi:hypothetical protein
MSSDQNITEENPENKNSAPAQKKGEEKSENVHESTPAKQADSKEQIESGKTLSHTAKQEPSNTNKYQDSNMEVHHHPDLHHHKKKFREYFLEFVMIFLAVTLGFFAESIRENISDREKEKQYIKSLIKNISDDTAQLREVIDFNNREIKNLDSFLLLSRKNISDPLARQLLYHFSYKCFFNEEQFRSNDATLAQLRNSGGYRLIQKDHVADSIALYDAKVNYIYEQGSYYIDSYKQIQGSLGEILDLNVLDDTSFYKANSFTGKELPLLQTDPQKIKQWFNKVKQFRTAVYYYCNSPSYLRGHLIFATRLIEFLKKEYDVQ